MRVDGWVRAGAKQDELSASGQRVEDSVVDEVHTLLPVDAANIGGDRFEVLPHSVDEPQVLTPPCVFGPIWEA